MSTHPDPNLSILLDRIRDGDDAATGELLNAAYTDLRSMAGNLFRGESAGHTLQPTALVNELCIRLLKAPQTGWDDRNHFFKVAAHAMRNLLIDHARARGAVRRGGDQKGGNQGDGNRGGGGRRVTLDSLELAAGKDTIDLLALDETITRLSAFNERLGTIFELRFLAGLTVEQTAEVVTISPRTVEKDCRFIRAWLHRELDL